MDWRSFEKEIRSLGKKIDDDGWSPDAVVAIVRGGVVPAMTLTYRLGVRKFYILKVSHVGESRRVKGDFAPDVFEKKVLVVEDMLESGKSLAAAKEYLEHKGAEVKTACLYTMPQSVIVPDFFLKQVPDIVEFPWEK